jgi:hypothetical protein
MDEYWNDFTEPPEVEGKDEETAKNDLLKYLKETQCLIWCNYAFLYCHPDVLQLLQVFDLLDQSCLAPFSGQ